MTPHVEQHEVGLFERHPNVRAVLLATAGFTLGVGVESILINKTFASASFETK